MTFTREMRWRNSSRNWGVKLIQAASRRGGNLVSLAGETLLHQRAGFAKIQAAGKSLLQQGHDLPLSFRPRGPRLAQGRLYRRSGFALIELLGHEAFYDGDLFFLLLHQFGAIALLVEDDALLT